MAGFSIDSSELLKLGADLGKIPATAEKLSRVAVRKTAADIKSTARSIVPVGKSHGNYIGGTLKNSIHTKATGPLESEVTASTDYAEYVEVGTSRMAAQPYMRPAADHHTPAFEQAMAEIVGRALNG